MARKLTHLVVVDIEATCWPPLPRATPADVGAPVASSAPADGSESGESFGHATTTLPAMPELPPALGAGWGTAPPDRQNEIIEIGLALLDMRTLEVSEKWSTFVAPQFSQVSPYCTSITNITGEMLAGAPSLAAACTTMVERFATRYHPWASWGDYDREQFVRQCARDGVKYPFGRTHFNLKSLFGLIGTTGKEVSMKTALEMLELKLEGSHHRAGDDAWNTAHIAREIFRRLKDKAPPTLKSPKRPN